MFPQRPTTETYEEGMVYCRARTKIDSALAFGQEKNKFLRLKK